MRRAADVSPGAGYVPVPFGCAAVVVVVSTAGLSVDGRSGAAAAARVGSELMIERREPRGALGMQRGVGGGGSS
jgi:hypothetical protein